MRVISDQKKRTQSRKKDCVLFFSYVIFILGSDILLCLFDAGEEIIVFLICVLCGCGLGNARRRNGLNGNEFRCCVLHRCFLCGLRCRGCGRCVCGCCGSGISGCDLFHCGCGSRYGLCYGSISGSGCGSFTLSKPVAMMVTRISSIISGSKVVPQMMLASGCASSWIICEAISTSSS